MRQTPRLQARFLNCIFSLSLWSGSFKMCKALLYWRVCTFIYQKKIYQKTQKSGWYRSEVSSSISLLYIATDKFWTTMWLKEPRRIYIYRSMYVHIHSYVHTGPDPALTGFGGTKHSAIYLKCSVCLITSAEPRYACASHHGMGFKTAQN